jgi:hypothetical protein
MGCAQTAVATCSECDGLWKECNDALEEYLKTLVGRNAARERRDYDLVEAYEAIETESLERCQKARQAIAAHEAAHILNEVRKNLPKGILATELHPV